MRNKILVLRIRELALDHEQPAELTMRIGRSNFYKVQLPNGTTQPAQTR